MSSAIVPSLSSVACPLCGAPNDSYAAHCTQCGGALLDEQVSQGTVATPRILAFQCDGCGSHLSCAPSERAVRCPFCDSPYVVERASDDATPTPDLVVPFAIEKAAADAAFHTWLGTGWFRPGDLMRRAERDGTLGIYIPCWMFSALAHSQFSAEIGEHWYETVTETYTTTENGKQVTKTRTKQVRHTEWFRLTGRHHRFYSQEVVSGSKGLADAELVRVLPIDSKGARRYRAAYLSGWLAEEASVDREAAWPRANERFESKERANVSAFLPGDEARGLKVATELHRISGSLVLLPIWLVTYRYRDKPYRFLMNGQTGKLTGKGPLSWPRIVAAALGAVALAALIFFIWRAVS